MEELAQNNRNMVTATVIMLVVTGVIVTFGMLLFPLTAYDNPNAGIIPGLINTPGGNLLAIGLLGLVAANIGVFLNRIIKLERERTAILEKGNNKTKDATSLPKPPRGSIQGK
jgi:hypothetical protein